MTDMSADWMPRGQLQYTVTRSCTALPAMEKCVEGSSSLTNYKDCQVSCDPKLNSGCNNNLDEVAQKFNDGNSNVQTCYACQYYQLKNGFVSGNPDCDKNVDNISTQSCPLYAQERF
jgi:hypothetical protein